MSDEDIKIQSNIEYDVEHKKHCNTCTCSCKIKKERKEYVKNAQRNYRLRKLENDPDYVEKIKEQQRKYIEKNKDKYYEYKRVYMQKYRAKKKAEKLAAASNTIESAMDNLTIKEKLDLPLEQVST